MSLPRPPSERASSETLGVAVLVGMTVLVTAGLGVGVLVMGQQQQQQTADVDFTFLSDQLVVVYQDSTDRPAGQLFIEGPRNNVSWAELDENKEPGDTVTESDNIRIRGDSAWGAAPDPDARYDLVFVTQSGERFILASVNDGGSSSSGGGTDTPTQP